MSRFLDESTQKMTKRTVPFVTFWMTERRIAVIPNAVRDLYMAIPAYPSLRAHPPTTPNLPECMRQTYRIDPSSPLGMTTSRRPPNCSGAYQAPKGPMTGRVALNKRRYMSGTTMCRTPRDAQSGAGAARQPSIHRGELNSCKWMFVCTAQRRYTGHESAIHLSGASHGNLHGR